MKLIYIVEDGRGNKKIGITGNIKQRVNQLKTAIPNGIISVMISDFMENSREIEKQLHDANKAYRLSGEWFSKVVDFSYSTIDVARKSILMLQDSLATIAEDKEITGQTLRVWMILLSELEFENYITTKQKEIATRLDMHQPDVSKAMKLLVSKGIILKVKEGTTTAYKLNSDYGWKGKISNLEIEKERVLSQKIVDMQKVREFNTPPASEVEPDFNGDIPY
ncbi:MAG: GIY-YIG nuclease family protein [Methylococcales bacterium]|nr:GIY-YIG nuclease family protein [Methylococcales bacterium]MDD5753778.1 GIY-YIG nuclease family protein [Methylococcales bacterium]